MIPRTYLFVPGNRPERFAKALASGADAVVLDLEDAVAPPDKDAARGAVGQFLAAASAEQHARLVLRINDEATQWFEADLLLLVQTPGCSLMLPKAEQPATLVRVRAACPGAPVLALVESARGVLNAEALAECEGVSRLVFGTIDYALDLDLDLSADPAVGDIGLDHAAARLALASRAAGLPAPVAGVTPDIDDETRLLADFARARAHGFGAKLCIHPKQVAPIHAALVPTATELDWARRVVAAAKGSQGAVQVDGRMVDKPVLQRALRLLARAAPR